MIGTVRVTCMSIRASRVRCKAAMDKNRSVSPVSARAKGKGRVTRDVYPALRGFERAATAAKQGGTAQSRIFVLFVPLFGAEGYFFTRFPAR